MTIYWASRHAPLPSQLEALKKLYGEEVKVIQDPRPFASAEEIVERYRESGANDIVVVAPLSVLARLTELGVKPLYAQMSLVSPEKAEVVVNGRGYRFEKFLRIERVEIVFREP